MQTYLAELIGTMILVLLGDGVVANVLLEQDQGAAVRLDRHHGRMGHRGRRRGLCGRPDQRRAPQSRRHDRAGDDRQLPVGGRARLHRGADARRDPRRRAGVADVPAALAPDAGPGTKLAVFCTGPASARPAPNMVSEIIGTAVLVFGMLAIAANAQTLTRPGDVDLSFVFSRGLQPLLVGMLVFGIGLSLGGPPATPSIRRAISVRASRTRSCRFRARAVGLGVRLDSRRRPDHRRHRRRGSLFVIGF